MPAKSAQFFFCYLDGIDWGAVTDASCQQIIRRDVMMGWETAQVDVDHQESSLPHCDPLES